MLPATRQRPGSVPTTSWEGSEMAENIAKIYELHLLGGGGDHACAKCLPEAKGDHAGSVVSVALIDDPSAQCQWCGIGAARVTPRVTL